MDTRPLAWLEIIKKQGSVINTDNAKMCLCIGTCLSSKIIIVVAHPASNTPLLRSGLAASKVYHVFCAINQLFIGWSYKKCKAFNDVLSKKN